MQEHIRRAHPEHYISKLPATEESFLLMINTPPSEKPQPGQTSSTGAGVGSGAGSGAGAGAGTRSSPHTNRGVGVGIDSTKAYPHDRHAHLRDDQSAPGTPRHLDDLSGPSMLPAASAAAALAQLGQQKLEPEWDSEGVCMRQLPFITYSFFVCNVCNVCNCLCHNHPRCCPTLRCYGDFHTNHPSSLCLGMAFRHGWSEDPSLYN